MRSSAYSCLRLSPTDRAEVAIRMVTFWQDGFQIEDGELLVYDDPILADFHAGYVYPLIFNRITTQSLIIYYFQSRPRVASQYQTGSTC